MRRTVVITGAVTPVSPPCRKKRENGELGTPLAFLAELQAEVMALFTAAHSLEAARSIAPKDNVAACHQNAMLDPWSSPPPTSCALVLMTPPLATVPHRGRRPSKRSRSGLFRIAADYR